MRIAFSVPRYHPNHDGMVLGLRRAGHEVHFLVRSTSPTEHYAEGVEVTRAPGPGETFRVEGWAQPGFQASGEPLPPLRFMHRWLGRVRPDLVIGRNASAFTIALFLLCRLRAIPFLLYVQSPEGYEQLPWQRRLLLWLGLWPAHTLSTVRAEPASEVKGKTLDFIPFAVEPVGEVRTDHAVTPPIRVLAMGKLDQGRKNHVPLVRALAPMLQDRQVTLTIVGLLGRNQGPAHADLLSEIESQGIADMVDLRSNLSYAESRRLYANYDLFILASRKEPAGISPLEAMAAGLAVIVGSDGGTRYFVEHGETGFIFSAGDFDDLRARVQHFVDAPSELRRMGQNALTRVEENFTPAGFERNLMRIFSERFGAP